MTDRYHCCITMIEATTEAAMQRTFPEAGSFQLADGGKTWTFDYTSDLGSERRVEAEINRKAPSLALTMAMKF